MLFSAAFNYGDILIISKTILQFEGPWFHGGQSLLLQILIHENKYIVLKNI